MATREQMQPPVVGRWYEDPLRKPFEVVSVDEEAGTIEVRYDDGETAEMELADWRHAMVEHDALPDEYLSADDRDEDR